MPLTPSRCAIHAPGMLRRRAMVGSADRTEEVGIAADDNWSRRGQTPTRTPCRNFQLTSGCVEGGPRCQ